MNFNLALKTCAFSKHIISSATHSQRLKLNTLLNKSTKEALDQKG